MDRNKKIFIFSFGIGLLFIISILYYRFINNNPVIVNESTYLLLNLFNISPQNINLVVLSSICLFLLSGLIFFLRKKEYIFASLYFLSPVLLYNTINFNLNILGLFFLILTLYLIENKKYNLSYLSALGIIIAPFYTAIIFSFIILAFGFLQKDKQYYFAFLEIFYLTTVAGFFAKSIYFLSLNNIITNSKIFIQEFGNYSGIGLIFILMAGLSFFIFLNKKSLFEPTLFLAGIISILDQNILALNILVLLFSSQLIKYFLAMDWEVKIFKVFSLIFILVIILNSLTFFTNGYINNGLNSQDVSTYSFLELKEDGVVIGNFNKINAIAYYSKKQTLDKYNESDISFANDVYYSTQINKTMTLLYERNIKYLIIDQEMQRDIWSSNKKGLLIMITNDNYFKLIYSDEKVKMYEVLKLISET